MASYSFYGKPLTLGQRKGCSDVGRPLRRPYFSRLSSAASASLIHSSWLYEKRRRAAQQKIQGGMDLISKRVHNVEPSKTELRASIPAYDEAMVKRIDTTGKGEKPKSGR